MEFCLGDIFSNCVQPGVSYSSLLNSNLFFEEFATVFVVDLSDFTLGNVVLMEFHVDEESFVLRFGGGGGC